MKESWKEYKLGEIFEINRGGSPRPISDFLTSDPDGINWIKIGDAKINSKYIFSTEEKIRPEGIKKSRKVLVGDFILSNSMSFGRPYIMKTDGCIHDGWLVLHEIKHIVDQDFLYYILSSDYVFQQFDRLAAGSTVRNLNTALVKGVKIPVPPHDEQQRIVAKLDEAFAAIDQAKINTEKNLHNVNKFFEIYLSNIISKNDQGWEEKKLGDIFVIERGGSPRPIEKFLTTSSDGVNWIKIGDTKGLTKYISKTKEKIKPEGVRRSRMVYEGDFILSNSMSFGRPFIMKTEGCIHDGWLVLREKSKTVNQDFLYYLLSSTLVYKQFDTLALGSTVRNLNIDLVKSVIVPIPPLREQVEIVEKMEHFSFAVRHLENLYQQKMTVLDKLKKSILQQAFNGEL